MNRRGLSLLETMFAISITALIGAAIATMMVAVSGGLTSRDDGRKSAVRLAMSQVRLGAYIAPSRCLLSNEDSELALWFEDSRESGTVHASEVRWIRFDTSDETIAVHFVDFPDNWSQSMIDAADIECTAMTGYAALLNGLSAQDLIGVLPLVDGVDSCTFWAEGSEPLASQRLGAYFTLQTTTSNQTEALVDETIRLHQPPQA